VKRVGGICLIGGGLLMAGLAIYTLIWEENLIARVLFGVMSVMCAAGLLITVWRR
jgi:hypothetical protein